MDLSPSAGEHVEPLRDLRPIVVGVSPDGRGASAVVWAADEAQRTGRTLRLVSAGRSHGPKQPSSGHDLVGLAHRLTLGDVEHRVVAGTPADVLLEAASDGALVVVGRRGFSRLRRRLIGGTSLTLATSSPTPVVVVPESWVQPSMCAAPVVVGVVPHDITKLREVAEPDELRDLIGFALRRAADLRVPLHVVSAWSVPPAFARNPVAVAACRERFALDLEERLASWREVWSEVDVQAWSLAASPPSALLQAERPAQLTVIGRHAGRHLLGTGLGSTTRTMLQRSRRPVAVVPLPDPDPVEHP